MDIIQLESISQSSSLLRITNGPLHGRIWINSGDPIDAETDGARGEEAFQRILSWKAGSFESLPGEASRPRTIFKSSNALLLESAQALDEHAAGHTNGHSTKAPAEGVNAIGQTQGVEFSLSVTGEKLDATNLENPERLVGWTKLNLERFRILGERLQTGPVEQVIGIGHQRHVAFARRGETDLCIGWQHSLSAEEIRERMKKLVALWGC